jgi:hypothetical protein
VAVIPDEDEPHEVRSVGDRPLRLLALYAAADVTTPYESEVQPAGARERTPIR